MITLLSKLIFLISFMLFNFQFYAIAYENLSLADKNIITDQAGRKIEVNKPFRRIISLYGAHTENLFSLGLDKEIIGVSKNEVYPQKAIQKPSFSYHDDLEKFLSARPDLILIRPMIDRGYPRLITGLEKAGITVISLQPVTIDEMFQYWKILGVLTGKQEKALVMTDSFVKAAILLKSLTKNITPKKHVYFEAIHNMMKTFSPDSIAVFALETAGGINVAHDAKPLRGTNIAAFGKERILSRGDKTDVYIAQRGTMNQPTVTLIKEETGFNTIKAVTNNEVYIVDEMIIARPTFRLLYGIYEIGKVLYPEVFGKESMKIIKEAAGAI